MNGLESVHNCWEWYYTSVFPVLRRLRQEDHKFKDNLNYIVSLMPCLKKKYLHQKEELQKIYEGSQFLLCFFVCQLERSKTNGKIHMLVFGFIEAVTIKKKITIIVRH
jgi:hypothetical protein